jgi:undecaprenyl-diphosphatase
MLHALQSVVLGIVEGITEFLPISSTAHLILTADLLRLTQTEFQKSFEIIIQFGAILAVVVLYWKKFWNWETIKRLIVAFIPTGIIGLTVYKVLKSYLLGNTWIVLASLLVGGILLIVFERSHKEAPGEDADINVITYKQCLQLGVWQAVAIIPGVSRSAATIVGGLLMGLKRKTIVEFSFMLAVPTMLAATGLDLLKSGHSFTGSQFGLLAIGFVVAFITAILAIKFLLSYIRKHNFTAFGWYRIALVVVFLLVMWVK